MTPKKKPPKLSLQKQSISQQVATSSDTSTSPSKFAQAPSDQDKTSKKADRIESSHEGKQTMVFGSWYETDNTSTNKEQKATKTN